MNDGFFLSPSAALGWLTVFHLLGLAAVVVILRQSIKNHVAYLEIHLREIFVPRDEVTRKIKDAHDPLAARVAKLEQRRKAG